jgi:hypothetical protein
LLPDRTDCVAAQDCPIGTFPWTGRSLNSTGKGFLCVPPGFTCDSARGCDRCRQMKSCAACRPFSATEIDCLRCRTSTSAPTVLVGDKCLPQFTCELDKAVEGDHACTCANVTSNCRNCIIYANGAPGVCTRCLTGLFLDNAAASHPRYLGTKAKERRKERKKREKRKKIGERGRNWPISA